MKVLSRKIGSKGSAFFALSPKKLQNNIRNIQLRCHPWLPFVIPAKPVPAKAGTCARGGG